MSQFCRLSSKRINRGLPAMQRAWMMRFTKLFGKSRSLRIEREQPLRQLRQLVEQTGHAAGFHDILFASPMRGPR
jgi:hypothetical protein